MSHPTETASLPLGHRWAPSIDEVRQGGIDRRLSQAASPHLHPPRRATPSHEEASLHLPYARPQAANQYNRTHLDAPAARHPHPARRPRQTVRRVWAEVGEEGEARTMFWSITCTLSPAPSRAIACVLLQRRAIQDHL